MSDRRLYRSSLVDNFAIKYSPEEKKIGPKSDRKKFGPIYKGLVSDGCEMLRCCDA